MIYIKINYKAGWMYYGPWKDININYNCSRRDRGAGESILFKTGVAESGEAIEICVDEIFLQGEADDKKPHSDGYTIVTGWDDGLFRSMALKGCTAYLLTPEGKTLDRI